MDYMVTHASPVLIRIRRTHALVITHVAHTYVYVNNTDARVCLQYVMQNMHTYL